MIFAINLKVVPMNPDLPGSRWAVSNGDHSEELAICDSKEQAERVRDKLYAACDAIREVEDTATLARHGRKSTVPLYKLER